MAPTLAYRRLRAPRDDGDLLLVPDWDECLLQPSNNRELSSKYRFQVNDRSYQSLRASARRELLDSAIAYVAQYADTPTIPDRPLVVMSGHQPAMYHPGVWAKNFVIDRIARSTGAVAIHVVIDNDTLRENFIRVPTGTISAPAVATEPFDRSCDPLPYECRAAKDLDTVRTFAERVQARLDQIVPHALVNEVWPDVLSGIRREKMIGHAMAESRHKLEHRWGLRTLELPVSRLCETNAFRHFFLHLLRQGQEVRKHYNHRLAEYRRMHRLRTNLQPLPDLRTNDQWTEAPFWLWSREDPVRRSLWSRQGGDHLEFGDASGGQRWTLKHAVRRSSDGLEQLTRFCDSGLRIRPRALTTSLFLRLFMSDSFIHGIGGAKYDQVTDLLTWDLFGVEPPEMTVVSQTSLLPVPARLVSKPEITAQRARLREMYFHPERFLDREPRSIAQVSSLEKRKRKAYELDLPRGERGERHLEITRVNSELRVFLQQKAEKQRQLVEDMTRLWPASQIFASREWAFCLFPSAFLRARLLDIATAAC